MGRNWVEVGEEKNGGQISNSDNNIFKSLYSCPGPMAKGKPETECDMKSRTRKEGRPEV